MSLFKPTNRPTNYNEFINNSQTVQSQPGNVYKFAKQSNSIPNTKNEHNQNKAPGMNSCPNKSDNPLCADSCSLFLPRKRRKFGSDSSLFTLHPSATRVFSGVISVLESSEFKSLDPKAARIKCSTQFCVSAALS